MASLLSLPGELVDRVCSFLPVKDIQRLRFTCKEIEQKSQHQFAVSYFNTVQFMTTRESLETLVKIAKDPRYGPRIKKLELCLVTFPEFRRRVINGDPVTDQDNEDVKQWKAELEKRRESLRQDIHDFDTKYWLKKATNRKELLTKEQHAEQVKKKKRELRKILAAIAPTKKLRRQRRRHYGRHQVSQATMGKQGIDVQLLTEALAHLPGLKSFALVDRIDTQEPPWGAKQLRSEIGCWFPTTHLTPRGAAIPDIGHHVAFPSHVLAFTFGAIIRSGVRPRGSLVVQGVPTTVLGIPKSPSSRRLRYSITPATTFAKDQIIELKSAFSELRHLEYSTNWTRSIYQRTVSPEPVYWYQQILEWSEIVYLELASDEDMISYEDNVKDTFLTTITSKPLSSRLRRLVLTNIIGLDVSDLVQIVKHHFQSLETLFILECYPHRGDFAPVLEALEDCTAMVDFEIVGERFRENSVPNIIVDNINDAELRIGGCCPEHFQDSLQEFWADLEVDKR